MVWKQNMENYSNIFYIKMQPNINEQEKKQRRIYELLDAETK